MNNITDKELAYLAGIVDGEGSVGVYWCKDHSAPTFQFFVTNTNFDLERWIRQRLPWAKIRSRVRKGSLGTKPIWEWACKNRKLLKPLLEALYPYMVIKAPQVKLMLSLMDDESKELGDNLRNKKPSPELVERRNFTVSQLKVLKVASTQLIQ